MKSDQNLLVKTALTCYAFTLIADTEGRILVCSISRWAGSHEDPRFEWRIPRMVYAESMANRWNTLNQPFQVVNNPEDYYRWFLSGGNALITKEILEIFMPSQLEPSLSIREHGVGWTDADMIPQSALQHAPTQKLRLKVLTRDQKRCLICGQRPSLDVNVVLHVHHITPHGQGGLTVPNNLITLCHTCHSGLDPHHDPSLYKLLNPEADTNHLKRHLEEVAAYRRAIRQTMQKHPEQA